MYLVKRCYFDNITNRCMQVAGCGSDWRSKRKAYVQLLADDDDLIAGVI